MKKTMIALLAPFALAGSLILSTAAMAQSTTPYINARQENQQTRIAQGVRSGELTAGEAARLERQEAKIQHQKYEAKKHGHLNKYERAKLNRKLNKESHKIYRAKHNRFEQSWAK